MLTLPEGRRSEPNSLFILAQTSRALGSHVAVIRAIRRNKLPRVGIVSIPGFLTSVQRTLIGVALSSHIVDSVSDHTVKFDTGHDCVLIRADNVSEKVHVIRFV